MEPTSEAVRVRNTGHPPAPLAGQVAAGVLGAGMLVMPSVVASLTGEGALLVWSAHLVLGATVSLLLALLVRTRRTPATLAGTVGALLGGWAARAVDGVFAVAFTAGQAAIAWFAATCLLTAAQGAPPRPGTAGLLLALALLVVAVAAALTPLQLPAAVLRLRPWAAGAVALACVAWSVPGQAAAGAPTSLAPPGLTGAGAWWLALAALFFAGVGWEVVTSAVPGTAAGARSVAGGVATGAAGVAVVHLGLAAVQQAAGVRRGGTRRQRRCAGCSPGPPRPSCSPTASPTSVPPPGSRRGSAPTERAPPGPWWRPSASPAASSPGSAPGRAASRCSCWDRPPRR